MKRDRVTLRVDDAISALVALRASIRQLDETLATGDYPWLKQTREYREEHWEAYQRIAKALGLRPTIDELRKETVA